jgi:hypothetical protein
MPAEKAFGFAAGGVHHFAGLGCYHAHVGIAQRGEAHDPVRQFARRLYFGNK